MRRKAEEATKPSSTIKRRRTSNVFTHPYGVKPLGNLYLSQDDCRPASLGLFSWLPDELIVDVLLLEIGALELVRLSETSKCLYVYTQVDTVWKELYIEEFGLEWIWTRTWKDTYAKKKTGKETVRANLQVTGLYSDLLYNTWYCSSIDPSIWATTQTMDRRHDLSVQEFVEEYESKGKPVVLSGIVDKWPAFAKWDNAYLKEKYGDISFNTDKQLKVKLSDYIDYCLSVEEERPIYLFDNQFAEAAPDMLTEYAVPKYFEEDFFSLLDDRPSYRWLLVGPVRAGATFHKDPNFTSAWNGLIRGRKKWIFWPPDVPPLGVIPSEDGLEVTVPASMVQWFNDFYDKTHPVTAPIECIQGPGDLVFVPSGWWHSVINLEYTVAVTQNFVSVCNAQKVFRFLQSKKDLSLSRRFNGVLKEHRPALYEQLLLETNEKEGGWEALVGDEDGENWLLDL